MPVGALVVICRKCKETLPMDVENSGQLTACPHCSDPVRIDVFPRVKYRNRSKDPERITAEDQASCFFHENYQAAIPCDGCGRFLCQLCDISFQGGHRCISCIEQMKKEKSTLLIPSEIRWANIASIFLLISVPFWFVSFLTLPIAVFLYFKFGRKKERVLPPTTRETFSFFALLLIITPAVISIWGLIVFASTA